MNPKSATRLPRREAIKWMLAAGATLSLMDWRSSAAPAAPSTGYGVDPDLMKTYAAGDLWPLTLTEPQRRAAAALCDVILPADGKSPAASELHVVDFIDEWISAPYEQQQLHREIVLQGLAWIDAEAARRHKTEFAGLNAEQQQAICDDICYAPKAAPEFGQAAAFFAVFRNLTAGGFYTTPAGWKDIGYVGNVPLAHFDGPPVAVLKYLGLA